MGVRSLQKSGGGGGGGGEHILFVGDVTITDTGFILYDAVRYVYNIAIGV